jgi:hypothetical protein
MLTYEHYLLAITVFPSENGDSSEKSYMAVC